MAYLGQCEQVGMVRESNKCRKLDRLLVRPVSHTVVLMQILLSMLDSKILDSRRKLV